MTAKRIIRQRALPRPGGAISLRPILSIFSGTLAGQAVALICSPLLSRMFSPSDFGIFAIISACVLTLGSVAAWRFDSAIPIPHEERDAYSLLYLGILAALISAAVGALVVLFVEGQVIAAFDEPQLGPWLWLVPFLACAMGISSLFNQLAVRHRRYSSIAKRSFIQPAATVASQLAAGVVGLLSGGLILGLGVGQVAGAASLIPGSKVGGADAKHGRRATSLRRVASRYRRFPLVLAPSGLLNGLGLQLPVLIFAFHYGTEAAGWLGLAQRVVAFPVVLITTSVAQAYLGELAHALRTRPAEADTLFWRVTRLLLVPAILMVAVLLLGGPFLFSLLFGAEWKMAGEFGSALALSAAAQLVAAPLGHTLVVFERQGVQLAWDTFRLMITSGLIVIIAWSGGSAVSAVWAFSIGSAIMYLVLWAICRRSVQSHRG